MLSRSIVLTSVALFVFGFTLAIIGTIMIISASKRIGQDSSETNFLKLTGIAICISASFLLIGSICTCVYVCVIGANTMNSHLPNYAASSSQTEKANYTRNHPSLSAAARAAGHQWSANTKFHNSANETRTMHPNVFTSDGIRISKQYLASTGDFSTQNNRNNLNFESSTNWSNVNNFPRLNRRNQSQSIETATNLLGNIPSLSLKPLLITTNPITNNLNTFNSSAFWLATNNLSNHFSSNPIDRFSSPDFLGTNNGGYNTVLHSGGQIRLAGDI